MKIRSTVLIIAFYLIGNLVLTQTAGAQNNFQPTKSAINPDSFFYQIDRGLEKIFFKFQFSNDSKINYQKALLEERFSELDYIARNKKLGQFETSSQRFAAQAGTLVEHITVNYLDKDKIRKTLNKYKEYLPKLRDLYQANSSFWLLIQQDIDSLNLYIDKLK